MRSVPLVTAQAAMIGLAALAIYARLLVSYDPPRYYRIRAKLSVLQRMGRSVLMLVSVSNPRVGVHSLHPRYLQARPRCARGAANPLITPPRHHHIHRACT